MSHEEVMRPLVVQVCAATAWLHELGIAHRDISLENILLTKDATGTLNVKLIDFGMATPSRFCSCAEGCGKATYQAPEMHRGPSCEYDAFMADAFAVGVAIFAMRTQDYPWESTRADQCKLFRFIKYKGLRCFLEKRPTNVQGCKVFADVFSGPLSELVIGLLEVSPTQRLPLSEVKP